MKIDINSCNKCSWYKSISIKVSIFSTVLNIFFIDQTREINCLSILSCFNQALIFLSFFFRSKEMNLYLGQLQTDTTKIIKVCTWFFNASERKKNKSKLLNFWTVDLFMFILNDCGFSFHFLFFFFIISTFSFLFMFFCHIDIIYF